MTSWQEAPFPWAACFEALDGERRQTERRGQYAQRPAAREADILWMRYQGLTLKAIGAMLGVTGVRVRQIEQFWIRMLRNQGKKQRAGKPSVSVPNDLCERLWPDEHDRDWYCFGKDWPDD